MDRPHQPAATELELPQLAQESLGPVTRLAQTFSVVQQPVQPMQMERDIRRILGADLADRL